MNEEILEEIRRVSKTYPDGINKKSDNDIKEILNKLNNKAEHYILYDYEVKQLLDCITNLQATKKEIREYILKNVDNTGWLEIGSNDVKELLKKLDKEEL